MQKLFFLSLILFLVSCTSSSDGNSSINVTADSQYQTIGEFRSTTSENGIGEVSFQIEESTKAFQLITTIDGEEIAIIKISSPNQEEVFNHNTYYSSYLTDGEEYQKNINTFNFPTTPSDSLESGTYTVQYQIKSKKSNISSETILITKKDSDLSKGIITLNVIFAGSVASSEELISNIKKAIKDYTIPTLNKAGLKTTVNYLLYPSLTSLLPNPKQGDSMYESVANSLSSGINLFMGADIKDFHKDKGHSGLSASAPGPVLPCKKSAIAFSLSDAVGDDGEFNGSGYDQVTDEEKDEDEGDEIRLFSDSISHEIFHYLGLRNSVEFSSNVVVWSDGLNSEKCVEKSRCEQIRKARENVMYPYPIKHDSTSDDRNYYWYVRNIVSSGQKELANLWVGIN